MTHVAIVGGGIVGTATAYYLSEQERVTVTLCEKGEAVGAGTTPRAAGGFRAQYSTPTHVELSKASNEVWRSFEAEFGIDIDCQQAGYGFLVRERTTAERIKRDVAFQNQLGVGTEFTTPEAARDRYAPGLQAGQFVAATHTAEDGYVDPRLAVDAFATLARENGVDVRTGLEVTDVSQQRGVEGANRVTGVETDEGSIEADYVVNAAGAWGQRVAAMGGVDIPITPKRRNGLIVEPETPLPEDFPMVIDMDTGLWMRPSPARDPDGTVMAGGHFTDHDPAFDPDDPDAFLEVADTEWAGRVLANLSDTFDQFGPDARVLRGWSGLYAITPSNHPIIEESLPRFVNAVGFSGRALMHSPAAARLVTEIVVDGEPSLVDTHVLRTDGLRDRRGPLPLPYVQDKAE
jgi:sarcosine oxidase subunit beta